MSGCGKLTEKSRVWNGDAIPCGTSLTFGVGKEPKRTVIHLCEKCEANDEHRNQG